MNELIKFHVADAAIAELSAKYAPLKVNGVHDQAGLAAVHEARMTVKGLRVDVEKTRVALKADALEYGRKVDAEAKRLIGLLTPIESRLEEEETAVAREKERMKEEERRKKQAALQVRIDALDACRAFANATAVAEMSEEQFAAFLKEAQAKYQQKLADDAEAERLRRAEDARLAAEREELQRQREAQEAEAKARREAAEKREAEMRAELAKAKAAQEEEAKRVRDEQEAERRKLEAERRAIELEKAKAEAAEKARLETEARIAREKAEAEENARRAKAEAELRAAAIEAARVRAEALRPDREKLLKVADAVEALEIPKVGNEAIDAAEHIGDILRDAAEAIRSTVATLNIEVPEEEMSAA